MAKNKRWWFFFLAPEIDVNEFVGEAKLNLKNLGLKKRSRNIPWGSSRFSLEPDENHLISKIKGKWRNLLRKSQKSDLVISHGSEKSDGLDRLIDFYKDAKKSKHFTGISTDLLVCLSEQNSKKWRFNYYFAEERESQETIGVLVCIIHGDTATYLIGNTNEQGRKSNANYSLLWNAVIEAKIFGCKWFDLGGFNENTPAGIRHFKEGLRGSNYSLIGEYRT